MKDIFDSLTPIVNGIPSLKFLDKKKPMVWSDKGHKILKLSKVNLINKFAVLHKLICNIFFNLNDINSLRNIEK